MRRLTSFPEYGEKSEQISEAREAFTRGDFELALDLCTQDIDSNTTTVELVVL